MDVYKIRSILAFIIYIKYMTKISAINKSESTYPICSTAMYPVHLCLDARNIWKTNL